MRDFLFSIPRHILMIPYSVSIAHLYSLLVLFSRWIALAGCPPRRRLRAGTDTERPPAGGLLRSECKVGKEVSLEFYVLLFLLLLL